MTTAAGFDETSRTHIFMADIKKGIKKITDTFLYHLVHLHNIWHFKPLAKKSYFKLFVEEASNKIQIYIHEDVLTSSKIPKP